MSRTRIPLTLAPELCDRCRRCVDACTPGALKVGPTYILVDWRTCDGCLACAKTCTTGAISQRESAVARPGTSGRNAPAKPATPRPPVPAPRRPAAGERAGGARPAGGAKPVGGAIEWTMAEAVALIAVLFAAFIGKDAVLASEAVRSLGPDLVVFARVGTLFGFYTLLAGALALLARRRDTPFLVAFGLRSERLSWRTRLSSVGLVLALLVGTRLVALVYGMTAQELGWDPPAREIMDLTVVFGPTVWGLILSVALVVVVAPIIEEIVFRGVVQRALASTAGPRMAVVIASAIFALSHVTAWLLIPLFVLGIACGWLAHTRSSLLPAIWLHAAYNALPVAVAFYLVW